MKQLPLNLQLPEDLTFENYLQTNQNTELLGQLKLNLTKPQDSCFYLWGENAVGKSHLLHACCNLLGKQGKTVTYIPLKQIDTLSPLLFEDLESLDLIVIDDIEMIAGQAAWEEALFHLFNRIATTDTLVFITANTAPAKLNLKLADLSSRLAACLIFEVHELNDDEKMYVLMLRAKQRGLNVSFKVIEYLMTHCSRDMTHLLEMLEKIDHESLVHKRPITVPFVKETVKM